MSEESRFASHPTIKDHMKIERHLPQIHPDIPLILNCN